MGCKRDRIGGSLMMLEPLLNLMVFSRQPWRIVLISHDVRNILFAIFTFTLHLVRLVWIILYLYDLGFPLLELGIYVFSYLIPIYTFLIAKLLC
ncbi:hypothetical protein Hanom_Chr07g00642681 [Helianthus anomalus]